MFFACSKEEIEVPGIQKPQKLSELNVSSNFDWKTTKDYKFNLKGNNNGVVKVLSESGTIYYKGFMAANTTNTIYITLPSYEKSVRLLFWDKDVTCKLTSSNISYNF